MASVVVVIATGALIVTVYDCVVNAPALSRAWMVNVVEPTAVGVPDITPVLELIINPAGKLPTETLNVSGAVPPVVAIVWL